MPYNTPTTEHDISTPGDWMPIAFIPATLIEPDSTDDINYLAYEDCLPWEMANRRATIGKSYPAWKCNRS